MAVKRGPDETVVVSRVESRERGMAARMKDPHMKDASPMPFDGKRMIFGGFVPLVDE